MNEFIAQFILESREQIEEASAGLLMLERSANDVAALDSVFRAFHTLKGGAAIVDFTAMERAVHAAEDVLSRVRAGDGPLTSDLIESCLACVDQASRWIDQMEASGAVPAGADSEAATIVERLARADRPKPATEVRIAARPEAWSGAALGRAESHVRHDAKTAVRFTPRSSSFFESVDPLALVASIPKLLWVDAEPIDTWPTLEELDPFASFLVFTALSAAPAREVSSHLAAYAAQCEIVELELGHVANSASSLPPNARQLIEEQLTLLNDIESPAFAGRVTSAGTVVANVLRYCGQTAAADNMLRVTEHVIGNKDSRPLSNAIAALVELQPQSVPVDSAATYDAPIARVLRVDAERVDALVRLTDELTVVKNAIGHTVNLSQAEQNALAAKLKDHHSALEHLIGELQRAVLAIRVLPLRNVLQRFPRVVREMSASLRKTARVLIEGDETEADKAIVEMLFEPLLHIVRNAMDHGVEDARTRLEAGKPEVATLRMRASRDAANVVIEVTDDGRGIDVARVREVAKSRELANAEALDAMPNSEIINLVFAAGFSTAAKVTALSGRGVGMDAVRTAVERVGGEVSIESRAGKGTTVRLTLPFSVMMTHVMTVEAGGQMFGIPLDAVIETIRIPREEIASVGVAKAIVHRNRTIPIFELTDLLRVRQAEGVQPMATIVIASVAGHLGGIRIDRLGERMEVMLKPLDGLLAGLPALSGTTILGDGRVLLVLDLTGVLQ